MIPSQICEGSHSEKVILLTKNKYFQSSNTFNLVSNTWKNCEKMLMCNMFTTPATCFCPNYQTWKLNIATAKEKATRKKEQFSLMPEKLKVPWSDRAHNIDFSKLQVRKLVTSIIRWGNEINEIIRKGNFRQSIY